MRNSHCRWEFVIHRIWEPPNTVRGLAFFHRGASSETFAPLLLKFGPKTIEVCITIEFSLKRFFRRKPEAESTYHWYLIMHMGRRLTVFCDEGELGSSVMLFTFSCCCCCPSQYALLPQCLIGHFVYPCIVIFGFWTSFTSRYLRQSDEISHFLLNFYTTKN